MSRVFRLNEKHCRSEGAGFANSLRQKGMS